MSAPRPRKISEFKPTFSNLAQTSHYQLIFGGLSFPLRQHLAIRGVDSRFIGETAGLLCSTAQIPGSSLGTADITGNFMGVGEKMAHTRIFTQIDLEFYVDKDYKTMKFLEHWTEFIASGSGESTGDKGYYFRMQYPEDYKCDRTKIIKFDRDYRQSIEYTFFGMFPISFSNTPVSYGGSDILKATASFNFDRYVSGKVQSVDFARGTNNNKVGGLPGLDIIDGLTKAVRSNNRNQKIQDDKNSELTKNLKTSRKGSSSSSSGSAGETISEGRRI